MTGDVDAYLLYKQTGAPLEESGALLTEEETELDEEAQ